MDSDILYNKIAVVAGGEGFLGKEFCKILNLNGAEVISCDLKSDSLQGCYRKYMGMDISCEESVKQTVDNIMKQYGKINIFVNSAAINPQIIYRLIKFENYSLKDWTKTIDVNLTGAFICCKEFGKVMKKGSIIVNIVSELGLFASDQTIYEGAYIKPADYGVSKAGVINLLWAVRFNFLKPGYFCN